MCRPNNFGPTASSVEGKADYSAFILNGVVSLPGQKEEAVKILRDAGALHSFVHESLFSFSSKSNLGEGILIRGVGMTIIPISAHRLSLTCGLVSGEVKVGVCPALPVEGVDLILGNDLAGTKVWADSVPPLVVTWLPVLQPRKEVQQDAKGEPDAGLFAACAVT